MNSVFVPFCHLPGTALQSSHQPDVWLRLYRCQYQPWPELSLSWLIALPISPQTVEYLSWEWLKVWWMASPCHSNWRFWLVLALAACPWNVCLSTLVGVCGGRCFVLLVVGKNPFCYNQLTSWISFFHWSCLAISTGERDFVRRSRPLNR